jgi:hypothetical protein
MPNRIIYCLASVDEIYECSYSLLKYLGVYNLKPPMDHELLIYTTKPALLEAYGAYFNNFELREMNDSEIRIGNVEQVGKILGAEKGNILYMPSNSYLVKELGHFFISIAQGTVFAGKKSPGMTAHATIPVLGFNSERQNLQSALDAKNIKSTQGFIEQYDDLREFRKLLKDFFRRHQEESIPNQVKFIHPIDAAKMQDEKNKFNQLPLYQRLLRKMMGKAWSIMDRRK